MATLQELFGSGFDTNSVPPQEDFAALPPDKYPVVVDKAEVKQTKAGDGHYIELTMTVVDGPFKNRKVWDRINIHNPSQKCVEFGLRSLAALGLAFGLSNISDTAQLTGRVCIAHVKVKGENNEVRTYSAINPVYVAPTQPVQQTTQPPVQPPIQPPVQQTNSTNQKSNPPVASGVKPPWAR